MTALRQLSFAKGEVAPSLFARVDTTAYAAGLATCRNQIVKKQGGLANRPGTKFIVEVKDSSKQVRLIDFVFNDDQTYVLEFGNLYMRVIRNGAQVTVSGVAAWNSGTNYTAGALVVVGGVNYYCIAANTNQTPPNATYWYALPGSVFEIPTPYLESQLMDLQYAQTADVMRIVHRSFAPRELARTGHTGWSLTPMVFGALVSGPSIIGPSTSFPASGDPRWTVTSVKNGEESLPMSGARQNTQPSSGSPAFITWGAMATADYFRVYRTDSPSGFIGIAPAGSTQFMDDGIEPDPGDTPPADPGLFLSAGNYPGVIGYAQQSLFLGATDNAPETFWKSKNGFPRNFLVKTPITDDAPVTATLIGKRVSQIRHLVEMRRLVALTSGGATVVNGNDAGIITPTAINARQQSYSGAAFRRPLEADALLYLHARGSLVLGFDFSIEQDGYEGLDLSIFSAHLFEGHTIEDWAFARVPGSIAWAVREDGTLLGLTFVKDQQMLAWHRHDTDGVVERVCVVPEGTEDAIYLVAKRTINGATKRYIERMHTRLVLDVVDGVFMDCSLTYDGRNTGSTGMTLSGSGWLYSSTLTLTASAAVFSAGDVGKDVQLNLEVENADRSTTTHRIKFRIKAVTSSTVVTGKPNKTIPTVMQNVSLTDWALAIKTVTGLSHLEGKEVSVLADGFVVASPNNADYDVLTVAAGQIVLDRPYGVIHVGLPFLSDIETLDIDIGGRSTLMNRQKLVNSADLLVDASRGVWVGGEAPTDDNVDPLEDLEEVQMRENEDPDLPVELESGTMNVNFKGEWNSNGRVFVRQVDPLPLSILAVVPIAQIGGE